jgi:signal transduction histidine kinase
MSTDWIPGAGIGVIGSVTAWVLGWRITTAKWEGRAEAQRQADFERTEDLRKDLRDLKEDWRSGISDVRKLAENMASVQSSQNVVNAVTAKAIESLTDKLDRHEACLADHTTTIRLLVDRVMSKGGGA